MIIILLDNNIMPFIKIYYCLFKPNLLYIPITFTPFIKTNIEKKITNIKNNESSTTMG